jgi:hypothetical protein
MAAQNQFFVTVRRKSPNAGSDLAIPERTLIPAAQVKGTPFQNTKRGGSVLKLLSGQKFELYENVNQYNTVVEPTNTNITQDYASDISAAGTTQGAATVLAKYWNKVSTITGGSAEAVKLPAASAMSAVVVENAHATATLKVFPFAGDLIVSNAGVAGSINASVDVLPGKTVHFAKSPFGTLTVLTAKEV